MPCEGDRLDSFTSEQLSELLEEHMRAVLVPVRNGAEAPKEAWDRVDAVWAALRRRHHVAD